MRKWHRWLVIFTGILLVWVAATGLVGQVMTLAGGEEHHGPPPGMAMPAGAKPALPQPGGGKDGPPDHRGGPPDLYHFIIDLHSGNVLGPVGKVISALLGAAMLFFSVSGMWMYIDMFRKRRRIGRTGLFWN
jgi:uncharacterized iron-regulated membrane protein